MSSKTIRRGGLLVAAGLLAATLGMVVARLRASDHADTAENYNRIGADLTDVFIFPSATDPTHVVLAMDVHGLIPTGQGPATSFDTRVLYQFKIDVNGDNVEDYVIQAKFNGSGPNQQVLVAGPIKPPTTGTTSYFARRLPTTGTINQTFSPAPGVTAFAGAREDPFFFDLSRFYQIFPDRMTPLTGQQVNYPNPNAPHLLTFRGFPPNNFGGDTSPSMDYLAGLNVLSLVVDLPRASLSNNGTIGVIHVWATTSVFTNSPNYNYVQQDRLARPVVNEALATVSNLRHHVNNTDNPTDDAGQLQNDIESFLTFPAGRSTAIKNVIEAILVPDVLKADLSQQGSAAYLGYETGGATAADGSTFGGRKLLDDVVDISLSIVFGPTIPALNLAPDDGKEIPSLETDNVGPGAKHFLATFPYLGNPQ